MFSGQNKDSHTILLTVVLAYIDALDVVRISITTQERKKADLKVSELLVRDLNGKVGVIDSILEISQLR